jgi:hypothetical protein
VETLKRWGLAEGSQVTGGVALGGTLVPSSLSLFFLVATRQVALLSHALPAMMS